MKLSLVNHKNSGHKAWCSNYIWILVGKITNLAWSLNLCLSFHLVFSKNTLKVMNNSDITLINEFRDPNLFYHRITSIDILLHCSMLIVLIDCSLQSTVQNYKKKNNKGNHGFEQCLKEKV